MPESVRKTLAPFQVEGVEFVLKKEGRAMIADEMGLGKTIQASVVQRYVLAWLSRWKAPTQRRGFDLNIPRLSSYATRTRDDRLNSCL